MSESVAGRTTSHEIMAPQSLPPTVGPYTESGRRSLSCTAPAATEHSVPLADRALAAAQTYSGHHALEELHCQLNQFEQQYSGHDADRCKPLFDHFDAVISCFDELNENAKFRLSEELSLNQIATIKSMSYLRYVRHQIESYLKQLEPSLSLHVENSIHPLLNGALQPFEQAAFLQSITTHPELVTLLRACLEATKVVDDNALHFSDLRETIYSLRNLRISIRVLIGQAYSRAGFVDQAKAINNDASLIAMHFGEVKVKPANSSISRRVGHFDSMYEALRIFKEIHGHCDVLIRYRENKQLAIWTANLRIRRKQLRLSKSQITRLDQLQFCWTSNSRDRFFTSMYEELKTFRQTHGHCDVPMGYEANPQLAKWISNLRGRRKKGRVSQDKIELLDKIDFRWETSQSSWYPRFEELTRFIKAYGHSSVPVVFASCPYLGTWVENLRKEYQRNAISEERKSLLASIGFDFELDDPKWFERFEQLRAFRSRHGHCRVPHRWPRNPSLAYWVNIQRDNKRWNKLTDEQIGLLQSLEFAWELPRGRPSTAVVTSSTATDTGKSSMP